MIIVGLSNSKLLGRSVAKKLNIDYTEVSLNQEEDEEMHFKFSDDIKNKRVFMFQSFYPDPSNSLLEVIFTATHAKDLGAKEIILVAPYLSHLKEEFRDHKYECRSVKLIGEVLSSHVDELVVVEPNLRNLKDYFSIPVKIVSCSELIKDFIKKEYDFVVGPDENATDLVKKLSMDNLVLSKKIKKNKFEFKKGYDLSGKKVVIVDDMVVSGKTLIGSVNYLNLKNNVDCIIVHPLMSKYVLNELNKNINKIVSCNTIKNETNAVDVSGLIARKIKDEWYS